MRSMSTVKTLIGALAFTGVLMSSGCSKKPEIEKKYYEIRNIPAVTGLCEDAYTVKEGDNLTKIAIGKYGLNPCQDTAVDIMVKGVQDVNSGVFSGRKDKLVNYDFKPCDASGKRPASRMGTSEKAMALLMS